MADGDGTDGRQRSAINSARYVVAEYVRVGVWLCRGVGVYLNFGGPCRKGARATIVAAGRVVVVAGARCG